MTITNYFQFSIIEIFAISKPNYMLIDYIIKLVNSTQRVD